MDNMHIYCTTKWLKFMNKSISTSGRVVCSHPKSRFDQRYHRIGQEKSTFDDEQETWSFEALMNPPYRLVEIELRGTDASASSPSSWAIPRLDSRPPLIGTDDDSNFYLRSFHPINKVLLFIYVYNLVERLQVWNDCIKQSLAVRPNLTKLVLLIVRILQWATYSGRLKKMRGGRNIFLALEIELASHLTEAYLIDTVWPNFLARLIC